MNAASAKRPDVTAFGEELALSGHIPTGMAQFDLDPDNQRITRQLILEHISPKKNR